MKSFKKACILLALAYLVAALFPLHLLVAQQNAVVPDWVGRALYFAYFLLFSTVAYGVQTRKSIYWRLIPALLVIFFLSFIVGATWTFIHLSLPWIPLILTFVPCIVIGGFIFSGWWRKQAGYFA
jgi:hypothetical protein